MCVCYISLFESFPLTLVTPLATTPFLCSPFLQNFLKRVTHIPLSPPTALRFLFSNSTETGLVKVAKANGQVSGPTQLPILVTPEIDGYSSPSVTPTECGPCEVIPSQFFLLPHRLHLLSLFCCFLHLLPISNCRCNPRLHPGTFILLRVCHQHSPDCSAGPHHTQLSPSHCSDLPDSWNHLQTSFPDSSRLHCQQ